MNLRTKIHLILTALFVWLIGAVMASGAEIVGPTEPVEVRRPVWLEIDGLAEGDSAMFLPSAELTVDGRRMQPNCGLFWATTPGRYTITAVITSVEIDWDERRFRIVTVPIQHTVVVEGEHSPDPPEPGPDPEPDPAPDKLAEMWVIVIEESRDRTAEQAQILLDLSLRNWLEENGHHFRLVDQDQPASDLTAWIARTEEHDLPRCFLVGEDGESVFEGPLPESKAAFLKLVKKWGAEK